MGYNLFLHFLCSLVLGTLTLAIFLCLGWNEIFALGMALLASGLETFFPPMLFYNQNVYLFDTAVMIFIAVYSLLELIRVTSKNPPRWVAVAQAVVMFIGTYTDWLFICFAGIVFLARLMFDEERKDFRSLITRALRFWWAAAIALAIYLLHLFATGFLRLLWLKYRMRAVDGTDRLGAVSQVWEHLQKQYLSVGGIIYLAALIAVVALVLAFCFALSRGRQAPTIEKLAFNLRFMAIFVLPPGVYVILLPDMAKHDFMAIKYSFAVVMGVVLLIAAKEFLVFDFLGFYKRLNLSRKIYWYSATLVSYLIVASYFIIIQSHGGVLNLFGAVDEGVANRGAFIKANVVFKDVVFSPNFKIAMSPPQALSLSEKRVYQVENVKDIAAELKGMMGPLRPGDYNLIVAVESRESEPLEKLHQDWQKFIGQSRHLYNGDDLHLYFIDQGDLENMVANRPLLRQLRTSRYGDTWSGLDS